jgi:peptidoglycan-N-acetylmuramic acid deacetylase
VKRLLVVLPLVIFVILLLAIKIGGCQWLPELPSDSSQTSMEESSASDTATPSASYTTASPSPTPAASGTTTTAPSTAEPTPTPTGGPDPGQLSNTKLSWYFNPPGSLGEDRPATIPSGVRTLIAGYDVIWQQQLSGRKIVYLTMDEGYEFEDNTTEILDTAWLKGVPITFFITGSYLANNPAKVERMLNEGHLVANHTDSHPDLADLAASGGRAGLMKELQDLEASFLARTGEPLAKIVRPPAGVYSERVLGELTAAGYRTVFWSFAYRDWETGSQPDPAAAMDKILGQLHNGSVILLHAVSNTNVAILPDLIDEIRARGYDFARIDEIP